jgi:hypothetical protein
LIAEIAMFGVRAVWMAPDPGRRKTIVRFSVYRCARMRSINIFTGENKNEKIKVAR